MKKLTNKTIIKSISYDQHEIIKNILKLYFGSTCYTINLDPTYGKGNFYKNGINKPLYKFDIQPSVKECKKGDCQNLNFINESIESIIFDPPFLDGKGKCKGKMHIKFKGFFNMKELFKMYKNSLKEFYRILKPKGILIFKCQDITKSKTYIVHNKVINMAEEIGFYIKDFFIKLQKAVMIGWNQHNQKHARKAHSYFIVMQKKKK